MLNEDSVNVVCEFLPELFETGWEEGLEALFHGIANAEGESHDYSLERIDQLAEQLLAIVKFHRSQHKAKDN